MGSVLRYLLGGLVQSGAGGTLFPAGTLAVNLLGCLAIGVLVELSESRGFLDAEMRALLMVGLLGGFTTFSAFANETLGALRSDAPLIAGANIVLSVGLGIGESGWVGCSRTPSGAERTPLPKAASPLAFAPPRRHTLESGHTVAKCGHSAPLDAGIPADDDEQQRECTGGDPAPDEGAVDRVMHEQNPGHPGGDRPSHPHVHHRGDARAAGRLCRSLAFLARASQEPGAEGAGPRRGAGRQEIGQRKGNGAILVEELGALRALPGMGHDPAELLSVENLQRRRGEQIAHFVVTGSRRHRSPSRGDVSRSRSFCIARRMRGLTVPSGWAIRAATSACDNPP